MFDVTPVTSPKQLDCGPTCLQMLLSYYGKEVNLDQLIRECNTRIIGCSGKDLLQTGRAHGLVDMRAYQMDAEELIRQDRPAIIHWKHMHWCVFCGVNEEGYVVIVNPDRGRYGLDRGTFTSFYSGIALFNGDPEDIVEPVSDEATAEDYTEALGMLGVSV